MKKRLLCTLLCAVMVIASALPAFAAKTIMEKPTVMVKFVDKKGNPVQGLSVSDAYAYIHTDHNGISDIDVGLAIGLYDGGHQGPLEVDFSYPIAFSATNKLNGETKKYNVLLSDKKTTTLVWDRETPAQTMANTKEKVCFRVVDQYGKPVTDVKFVLPLQTFLLPTNTNGKTWYTGDKLYKAKAELYYKDSKGNDASKFFRVTVSDKTIKAGNKQLTFKVKI